MADGRYSRQDLANAAHVSVHLVSKYVRCGYLPPAEGGGATRYYTRKHLIRLRQIRAMLRQQMNTEDIVDYLDHEDPEDDSDA